MSKVDAAHPLANPTVLSRLTGGALEGMTGDNNTRIVNARFASKTAGTETYARESLPAIPMQVRLSAKITVDKSASGRAAYVGLAHANAAGNNQTAQIGYRQGTGIHIVSPGFTFTPAAGGPTLLPDASCVDGAEYLVTLTYENAGLSGGSTAGRVFGSVQNLDGSLPTGWTDTWSDVQWNPANYQPRAVIARTNSNRGTIRDLTYVDSMLGVGPDSDHLVRTYPFMGDGTVSTDRAPVWSTPKASPLRVVLTAGGSASYGGAADWGAAGGRNSEPWVSYKRMWHALAMAGYTVVHPHALHEGWGADDHLAKNVEALDRIKAVFGEDVRLYYLSYSMGGASLWRAVLGRGGMPTIRAAYNVAGISDITSFYDNGSYPAVQARWPDRALIEDPQDVAAAEYLARGTQVRALTSTGDGNVPKATHHDPMAAKYAGSTLYSEQVTTNAHFDAAYWDTADAVTFFDAADATPEPVVLAAAGSAVATSSTAGAARVVPAVTHPAAGSATATSSTAGAATAVPAPAHPAAGETTATSSTTAAATVVPATTHPACGTVVATSSSAAAASTAPAPARPAAGSTTATSSTTGAATSTPAPAHPAAGSTTATSSTAGAASTTTAPAHPAAGSATATSSTAGAATVADATRRRAAGQVTATSSTAGAATTRPAVTHSAAGSALAVSATAGHASRAATRHRAAGSASVVSAATGHARVYAGPALPTPAAHRGTPWAPRHHGAASIPTVTGRARSATHTGKVLSWS